MTLRELFLDVEVTRADVVESRHRVHAAVVGSDDALTSFARDHTLVTMWRSCAKPFLVLPFLASGGFDQLGWGNEELALSCASHGGEPEHVALAARMLESMERDFAPSQSWRLVLETDAQTGMRRVVWVGEQDGAPLRLTLEPDAGVMRQLRVLFYSLLPGIEELL